MDKLIVVVENDPARPGLMAEHGLSLWIEHDDQVLLYDTGAGRALLPNLAALGLDPGRIDAIVLSHGHYDHVGGLAELTELRTASGLRTPVWCHPGVFAPHLKEALGRLGDIGPPKGTAEAYEALGAEFYFFETPVSPWPGVTLLAPVARRTDFETTWEGLVTRGPGGAILPDPFDEDLALVIESDQGIAALTGCAHAGIINVLLAAEEHLGRPLDTLAGGTHLGPASAEHRAKAFDALAAHQGLRLAAGHCTGHAVVAELTSLLGDRFTHLRAGMTLRF
jgi:7,8-dihydropterin-6-yl-methyl-4-(beta-D-ribofuranosyl)aminobenzene 5'-phosphate synthase